MPEPLLAIDGLTKTFHVAKSASGNTRLKALDGISLTVGRGETSAWSASPAAASPPWRGP
jgi:oligopeptide transport system ATP-binding protein